MTTAEARKGAEPVARSDTPFLSHSRINRYLHCPEQYRLYYVERLRPRRPAASLVFGRLLHEALAGLLRDGVDPVTHFGDLWDGTKELELDYGQRESWDGLRTTGRALLARFASEELPRLGEIRAVEERFTFEITSLDVPFVGVVDLVAELDGTQTVIDFKTAGSAYREHEAALSDQLTAYRLANPEVEQAALCILVKTKRPRIAWQIVNRSGDQVAEYLEKVGLVAREIEAARFYKRPGLWCSWCDYLPCCLGDERRVQESLIRVGPGRNEGAQP